MKVLIINTTIDETANSRALTGIDAAITFELYKKYNVESTTCYFHITANHLWSKYTFIDEKDEVITTSGTMSKVLEKTPFLGNVLILTHEQWLDKVNPEWRTVKRYKYW